MGVELLFCKTFGILKNLLVLPILFTKQFETKKIKNLATNHVYERANYFFIIPIHHFVEHLHFNIKNFWRIREKEKMDC